jgi:AraC-like DNA-binding protein
VPRPRLDAERFAPGIAPQMFVRLLDLTKEFGVAPQRVCAGLGCTVDDLRCGAAISNHQAWQMIRRALRLTGRPDLGLELGIRENLSHYGLPGLAMSAARTFGHAARIAERYQNQTGGICSMRLEYDEAHATAIVDSNFQDESVLPFVVEEFFASALAIGRVLVGVHFHMQMLEVAYPAPAHAERYRQMFACPVHFGCSRNRAQIARSWLTVPIATHCAVRVAELGVLLEKEAEAKALPARFTAAVEQLLLRPGNARLSINQVAGALQLSTRTLRRRLSEEGASFRTLSEHIRVQTAQRLLREQGMTVAAAAEQLGFSDARAFRRAFKRWQGQVPGEIRQPNQYPAPTRGTRQ